MPPKTEPFIGKARPLYTPTADVDKIPEFTGPVALWVRSESIGWDRWEPVGTFPTLRDVRFPPRDKYPGLSWWRFEPEGKTPALSAKPHQVRQRLG
jgi:hypothetical protein